MRRAIVVPGKHVMSSLIISPKESKIKSEALPVHMNHTQNVKKQLKFKRETPAVMMHEGQINGAKNYPYPQSNS